MKWKRGDNCVYCGRVVDGITFRQCNSVLTVYGHYVSGGWNCNYSGWHCTRARGHKGPHVHCSDGAHVKFKWNDSYKVLAGPHGKL